MSRYLIFFLFSLSLPGLSLANIEIKSNQVYYFVETDNTTLNLEQAKEQFETGSFNKTTVNNLTFGINSNPVWLYLQIDNLSEKTERHRLVSGISWIDYLDLYFENSLTKSSVYNAGDRVSGAPHNVPGIGIAFDLELTPGTNNVFLRAETVDSIIFPIRLISPDQITQTYSSTYIYYGLIYGFLLALIIINMMFYRILGNKVYLYYSLAVASFVIINIGYTGYGIYWLWSDSPGFQNYAVLSFLVIYSVLFLSFGRYFLHIDTDTPRLNKAIKRYQLAGLILLTLALIYNNQLLVGVVAYFYLAASALLLIILSVFFVKRTDDGKYFLIAIACGMTGIITSDLVVIGVLPFTTLYYHSAEIGITLEATILALALTKNIKMREISRIQSEKLASYDQLTNLHNRRSFYQAISPLLNKKDPLCLIMIDVDKFKAINDKYGHNVGDQALIIISKRIRSQLRNADIATRWGGEEILVLLPNTAIETAEQLAERMRKTIEQNPLHVDDIELKLSISLGVAQFKNQTSVETFIDEADHALMQAKETGRNKVVISHAT